MKKVLALLLAVIMVASLTGCGSHSDEAVTVRYFCSVGAYLGTLNEEINKWNGTTGKEKGIFIELISEIENYSSTLAAFIESGTDFELYHPSEKTPKYLSEGYVLDLTSTDNDELNALVERRKPYLQPAINVYGGKLTSLPLEVLPIKMSVNTDLFEKNGLELPKTWDDVVYAAKVITENSTDSAFGFGWSNWTGAFRRLLLKSTANSAGRSWWDPNTQTYDFSPYRPGLEAITEMYQNGYMLGADDLGIDEVRAQFSAGNVGMFVSPSYDYGVFTSQFPAVCNWTVIDVPVYDINSTTETKGVYICRGGCSVNKKAYDAADERTKDAIITAFCFLNGDELLAKISSVGGIIPFDESILNKAELSEDIKEQWTLFCDLDGYIPAVVFPDLLLPLDGENYSTVLSEVMHGDKDTDSALNELNTRYNDAYAKLAASGEIDLSDYAYEYIIK